MTQLDSDDVFSYVYTVLFDILEDHEPFSSQFRDGNLIRFDKEKLNPIKPPAEPADYPQCQLEPSGFEPIQADSSQTQIILRHQLQLKTDDWRVQSYGKVAWEAIRAWMTWRTKANETQWTNPNGDDRPIITDVWVESADTGQAQSISTQQRTTVLDGFSTLLQVNVRLNLATSEIMP